MFVGARPWQLLSTRPVPESEWETAPFEVFYRTEEEPRTLGITVIEEKEADTGWFDLNRTSQRLAAAIALDMVANDLPHMYRDSGYIPGSDDIDTINLYIEQLERDPTGNSISVDLRSEVYEIVLGYDAAGVGGPLAMFGDAVHASLNDIELNLKLSHERLQLVFYCMVILSKWLEYPYQRYTTNFLTREQKPSFTIDYQIILSPISLIELIENAEESTGIWWAEFMNALAVQDAAKAQIQ